MYRQYKEYNFRPATLKIIEQAENIIDEMGDKGYTLTLRQLYYQFVGKDLIPNTERSYKNLGSIITKARMSGDISWSAIEDRNRSHVAWLFEEDPTTIFDSIEYGIRYDFWERQDYYVEAWIEKDALSNVLAPPCRRYDVPFMACKGYLSASEAWAAGQRFKRKQAEGKKCVLLHLGDHDPSGMDMTRDNADRLRLFSENDVEVKRLALNMEQIDQYSPPPNPAKVTDSRATGYIDQYGHASWELDALEPEVIEEIVESNIRQLIDFDKWDAVEQEENEVRASIAKISDNYDEIMEFVKGL